MNTNCEAVRDQLPDYIRGNLDSIAAAALEQHIASCSACAEE
ncbi:MAG: zf-HC2 domain-containing protein, partial [Acidobacteriaceae bacterium]|nr:zf-HC2 domain-containing protein [Acidobacteriaceae bacterium]